MYKIIRKEKWHDIIYSMWIEAPSIAQTAEPGQFIILMIDEKGERIPLTIADYDRGNGLVQIVFQTVGKTTMKLAQMNVRDTLFSFVGPLGNPSKIEKYGTVVTIGGGTGIACIYPITRALKEAGNKVIAICGASTKNLIIIESEMRKASTQLLITTDDGSYMRKGFVTEVLGDVLQKERNIKKIWAVGPAIMMKAVCDIARPYNVETIVSLNAVMVDGTGMCGTCRVTVDGETKFACVDGPEFNGQSIDWREFMNRLSRYQKLEKLSMKLYTEKQQKELVNRGQDDTYTGKR